MPKAELNADPPERIGRQPAADSDVAELLVEMGCALGRSNYPAPQSRRALARVADAYATPTDVVVLPTWVMATDRGAGGVTLRHVPGGYRYDQMGAVQASLAEARTGHEAPMRIMDKLRAIPTMKAPLPGWVRAFGWALSAFGFAAGFRLGSVALAVSVVLGLLVGAAVLLSDGHPRLQTLMPFLATLGCALLVSLADVATGVPDSVRLIAVPVLHMLPGAALVAGTIELVSGDPISGVARLGSAVMQLALMAFGFVIAVQAVGLGEQQLSDLTQSRSPGWLVWVGVLAYAAGTMLFLCTPARWWIPSLGVIVVAQLASQVAQLAVSPILAAGVATAVSLLLAVAMVGRKELGPVLFVVFMPAFFWLVPASMSFVALAGAGTGDPDLAGLGVEATLLIVSMAVGAMVGALVSPLVGSAREAATAHR